MVNVPRKTLNPEKALTCMAVMVVERGGCGRVSKPDSM